LLSRRAIVISPLVYPLAVSSCRPRRDLSQYTIEDYKANLLSEIQLGNPEHGPQLKSGFHQIEEGSWRWTEPEFSVELKAPFAGQKAGATLYVKAVLPEVILLKTGPVTCKARVNSTELGQHTYPKAGEIDFRLEVPPAALRAEELIFTFTVSPGLPPNSFPGDGRALGWIVSAIGLEKKTI
jgi:hypothetical protein